MNKLCCGRLKEGKTTLAIALGHEYSPGVIVWDPRHMQRGVIVRSDRSSSLADHLETAIKEKKFQEGPIILWPSRDLEGDFEAVAFSLIRLRGLLVTV